MKLFLALLGLFLFAGQTQASEASIEREIILNAKPAVVVTWWKDSYDDLLRHLGLEFVKNGDKLGVDVDYLNDTWKFLLQEKITEANGNFTHNVKFVQSLNGRLRDLNVEVTILPADQKTKMRLKVYVRLEPLTRAETSIQLKAMLNAGYLRAKNFITAAFPAFERPLNQRRL